jgi:hypothetical protein
VQEEKMRKKILVALTALILVSAMGYANTFSLRGNYFVPGGPTKSLSNSMWKIEYDNMDYGKNAFHGMSFGFAFEYFLTRELSLEFSIDAFYSRTVSGAYKDYLGFQNASDYWAVPAAYDKYMDVNTFSTGHSLRVSITPIQMTLKIAPFGRRGTIIPYVGGGIGVYFWNVRMEGDLIDFSDEYVYSSTPEHDLQYDLPVYPLYSVDAREEQKIEVGYHVLGGFMVAVGKQITLDIGAKYNIAKGKMTDSFQGFDRFDLGGFQISLGLNYWF